MVGVECRAYGWRPVKRMNEDGGHLAMVGFIPTDGGPAL